MDNKLIFQQLSKIMADVKAIGKEKRNQEQKFQYRGIDDMYNELHELFAKHEVTVMPQIVEQERRTEQTKSGSNLYFTVVTVEYHFIATDGSETFARVRGEGADMADKSSGKAQSNAMKYALMECFLIPTEDLDDADATTPEPTVKKPQQGQAQQPPSRQTQPEKPAPAKQPFSKELYLQAVATAEKKAFEISPAHPEGIVNPDLFKEGMEAIFAKVTDLHKAGDISEELFKEISFQHNGTLAGLV